MNSVLNSALLQVSRALSVDFKTVEAVYKSYWCFIHENTGSASFNIPYIGKLYMDDKKIERIKTQLKNIQNVTD